MSPQVHVMARLHELVGRAPVCSETFAFVRQHGSFKSLGYPLGR
jgi:hypothetical protein